jgi:hypothetical protein
VRVGVGEGRRTLERSVEAPTTANIGSWKNACTFLRDMGSIEALLVAKAVEWRVKPGGLKAPTVRKIVISTSNAPIQGRAVRVVKYGSGLGEAVAAEIRRDVGWEQLDNEMGPTADSPANKAGG